MVSGGFGAALCIECSCFHASSHGPSLPLLKPKKTPNFNRRAAVKDNAVRPGGLKNGAVPQPSEDFSRADGAQSASREGACFETFFNFAPPAMVILDGGGAIVRGNTAFCCLFGFENTEALGRPFSELVHPESRADFCAWLAQGPLGEQPRAFCREWPYLRDAAENLCCETSVFPKRADSGAVEYLIVHIDDVTVRQKAAHLVKQAAERKDEFLAMLGHELRNPLNAIRHAVQTSMEAKDDPFMLEWAFGVVNRQSLQLSRMVDDLLDLGRINMQTTELHMRVLDLRLVLGRAQTVVRHLLDARGLMFVALDFPPLLVFGDEARLEQVFVNVLHNAVKFTPEGGWIRVNAKREGAQVVVAISDSGIGIAPEMQGEIFDLFRQADISLDRAQGGLGIGLTVVKSLVEKHGGTVEVSSPGLMQGSTVTVRLPHMNRKVKEQQAVPAAPSIVHGLRRTVRVLVVEDNPDTAEGLRRLLVRRNCEVRVAGDGRSGTRMAREFEPEVLLLDLGLPGLDGYEMVRLLRKEAKLRASLFIAVSGYAQESDRARSLEAGFDYHCSKPLDFPFLMSLLRSRCAGA